jgi:biopolymer transport protein ExbD
MALRSRNKVTPNFNMSSMTDIVFLLLIFFMLTSTLVSPNALKLLLPSSKAKTLEKQTISISITKDIQFYINENPVLENTIEQELKLIINNEQEPAIILHTDKSVSIEHVVKIMDIAYRNKYKIVLATTPN